jgi:hypothetical protein
VRGLAKDFIRRYDPDVVKFDFGYELPSLSEGAPKDMACAGERLLMKGLDVVVGAMKEVKPDVVVMYYALSPLFIQHFDLHSPDDMMFSAGEYNLEANRRFFFSSLLGEIGMPTYSSSGYDWITAREIWFDATAMGTIGSLHSFAGDEQNSGPTPERIAKFNGLSNVLRPTNLFSIEPLDGVTLSSQNGARSSSWARIEEGRVTFLALRDRRLDGTKGAGRYGDRVETNAQVVVASKTDESIFASAKLGIVPFGDGDLTILREDHTPTLVSVVAHRLGGSSHAVRRTVQGGLLQIPFRERSPDGTAIEWIEVDVTRGGE